MTTSEIAHRLVNLCREQKNFDAMNELYAGDIVSIEAAPNAEGHFDTHGKPAVIQKSADWAAAHEIHSGTTTGPFVAQNRFAVLFDFDITNKANGQRMQISEVAVYTVDAGQIVREEFLYSAS
jgi:hypothetical protein